jgi:arylsulfatase A-like enzyme
MRIKSKYLNRREVLALHFLVGSLVIVVLIAGCIPKEVKPPNMLVIMVDDLGFSDLGCYGGEIKTPNLDQLAFNGLRFTQFNNTGRCWPSRASLLTGYYPQQIGRDSAPGIQGGGGGIRPDWARLVPMMLKGANYRSYHSRKWHMNGMPLKNGFDRSYYLKDQGRFFSPKTHYLDDKKLPEVERGSGYYATIEIAEKAIKHLKEHREKFADRPFFSYVAFTAPHFPLHALKEDIEAVGNRYEQGWEKLRSDRWDRIKELGIVTGELSKVESEIGPPYHFPKALELLGEGEIDLPIPWDSLSPKQKQFQQDKMTIHAAMIERVDKEIGRIIDQLKTMDALDNTLIVFLSDNGASAEIMVRDEGHDPESEPGSAATYLCLGPGWSNLSNTPFRRHKTWVHEGGTGTPFIAHWPDGIAARGELRHTNGHITDVVPTILDLARVPNDSLRKVSLPGQSLRPLFEKETGWEHPVWYYHEGNRALRVGNWKIVADKASPWELFNLDKDRTESKNLADNNPDKVIELEIKWNKMLTSFREDSPYKSTMKNKVSTTTENLE